MHKETPHTFSHALMEEYFSERDGIVYHHWRIGGGNWNIEVSPYKQIPWAQINIVEKI